jgi:hypothetical protein
VKIQERYDNETDHSLKVEKQEKWNAQVASDLEALEEFKEPVFRVRMEK